MLNKAGLERILYLHLPKTEHHLVPLVSDILIRAINGDISQNDAQRLLGETNDAYRLIQSLAGKEVSTPDATIAFGENSQTGDISIRDVAGNDIVHLTVNITQNSPDKPRKIASKPANLAGIINVSGLIIGLFSCIAAWIVVPDLRNILGLDGGEVLAPSAELTATKDVAIPISTDVAQPSASTPTVAESNPMIEPTVTIISTLITNFPCTALITSTRGTNISVKDMPRAEATEKSFIPTGVEVTLLQSRSDLSGRLWYEIQGSSGIVLGWVLADSVALSSNC